MGTAAEIRLTVSITPDTGGIRIIGFNYVLWKLKSVKPRCPKELTSTLATSMPLETEGSRPWNIVTWAIGAQMDMQCFSSCSVPVADQSYFDSHIVSLVTMFLSNLLPTSLVSDNICRFICIITWTKRDLQNVIIKQLNFCLLLSQLRFILWE